MAATQTDTRHHRFELDGFEYHLMFADYSARPKNTRIYVSGEEQGPLPQPESFEDEPENNKLWRAYNRQELANMRVVLDAGLDKIRDQLLGAEAGTAIRFSRKAGCSCGCSPGFVIDSILGNKLGQIIDSIWITKKAPERTFTMADFDLEG